MAGFLLYIAILLPDVCQVNPCYDFGLVYDEALFGQSTDHILRLTYNDNTLPGYDINKITMGFQMEADYYDPVGGMTDSEWIFSFTDNNGFAIRPLQVNVSKESQLAVTMLRGSLHLYNSAGTTGWEMNEELELMPSNGSLYNPVSGDKWIYQNSGTTKKSLIHRTGDVVVLGDGGDTVGTSGSLGIGRSPAAMLHLELSETVSSTYIPIRLQPTVTTSSDVYGLYHYLTVNVQDGAYPTSVQAVRYDPPAINLGSEAQLYYAHTLYVTGAPTAAYRNYALYVDGLSATSKIAGTLEVGALRILNKCLCTSFDEDICFVVEDAAGAQYEIPARPLE